VRLLFPLIYVGFRPDHAVPVLIVRLLTVLFLAIILPLLGLLLFTAQNQLTSYTYPSM